MKIVRSYRRRGSPDLPVAVYFNDAKDTAHHPNPEYHPETEIVLVVQGTVWVQIDEQLSTFRQGDIFTIPGNAVHRYQAYSEGARTCTVVFSVDALAMLTEHYFQKTFVKPFGEGRLLLPELLQPGHPAYEAVRLQMDLLQRERIYAKYYKMHRFSALVAICTALFPYCRNVAVDQTASTQSNEAVRLCLRYLHNNHDQKITLAQLAKMCHLHPNYLSSLFKKHTGQTIFEYLTNFRIETATRLLKKEDLPISKVGELVGFTSESLFYRQFKAIMGVTPKAYAKQHRGE